MAHSPLSPGGWGREWERAYISRRRDDALRGEGLLEKFPTPPPRAGESSSGASMVSTVSYSTNLTSPFEMELALEENAWGSDRGGSTASDMWEWEEDDGATITAATLSSHPSHRSDAFEEVRSACYRLYVGADPADTSRRHLAHFRSLSRELDS
jgi:hypothetical protein